MSQIPIKFNNYKRSFAFYMCARNIYTAFLYQNFQSTVHCNMLVFDDHQILLLVIQTLCSVYGYLRRHIVLKYLRTLYIIPIYTLLLYPCFQLCMYGVNALSNCCKISRDANHAKIGAAFLKQINKVYEYYQRVSPKIIELISIGQQLCSIYNQPVHKQVQLHLETLHTCYIILCSMLSLQCSQAWS